MPTIRRTRCPLCNSARRGVRRLMPWALVETSNCVWKTMRKPCRHSWHTQAKRRKQRTTAASGDENRAERGQGAEGDQGGDRG